MNTKQYTETINEFFTANEYLNRFIGEPPANHVKALFGLVLWNCVTSSLQT